MARHCAARGCYARVAIDESLCSSHALGMSPAAKPAPKPVARSAGRSTKPKPPRKSPRTSPRPVSYRETEPSYHAPPPLGTCLVDDCSLNPMARGLCQPHYDQYRRSGNFERVRDSSYDSPFYANKACPLCGSKATVPFDQTPEVSARLGRKPAVGLGNCCACGFIFSASAPSSSVGSDGSPRPITGGDGGGEPQESGVASAAASVKDPGEASRRGPKRLQEQPQRAG